MSDSENPYRTPSVAVLNLEKAPTDAAYAAPARTVSAGHGSQWIGEGWRLFKDEPLMWFAAMLLFFGFSLVLGLIPVLGSLASMLLAPSLSVGVLAFGRGHARQGKADIANMLVGFSGEKIGPLMIMALLYLSIVVVTVIVLVVFMAIALGGVAALGSLDSEEGLKSAMLGTGGLVLVLGFLAFMAVMMVVMAAYWFAPGLIFYAGLNPVDAMKESFMACMRNWLPFLVYSLLATVLLVAAFIPFGLGLLVFFPVMMATMYPGFEDLFGREI